MDLFPKAAMTMTLYYNGEPIITYDPNSDDPDNQSKKKCWMNSFDPQHQGVNASELTATYTIDFSQDEMHKAMFRAFYNTKAKERGWIFDEEHYSYTY